MGRGRKLERFAEIKTFSNVLEPDGEKIRTEDFPMKGKWKRDYFRNDNPLVLELGCGKGEYTVGLSEKFPGKNFIGLDIKGARMWKGAKYAMENKLVNAAFVRTRIEFIERIFDSGEVDEIWITFPDPFPKKPRNRLSSSVFLNRYGKIISDGGIVHLKTDSRQLHEYTLAVLEESKVVPEIATSDLYTHADGADDILSIRTFYEKMFLKEGKPITYLNFRLPSGTVFVEPDKDWE